VIHPAIRDLLESLNREPAFQEIVSRLNRDPSSRLSLSGLTTTAKALYLVLLWQLTERNLIVVVDGNKEAEALGELVATFFDLLVTSDFPKPQTIPSLDVLPWQGLSPHSEISEQRAVDVSEDVGGPSFLQDDLVHACPVGAQPEVEHASWCGPVEVQRQFHHREGASHVKSRQSIRDPRQSSARGRLPGE